uniref:Uncharacterized protein n=1 Tax=Meloidogyne enterolobii TaxID=390850 RepID=A0A6V7UNG8_MELEN|nr:unnamed protein product [Meloidogyne enterolobii]
MNKKNELRLKLLSRQQHIPKAKRPAALVASAAVAPVKRSKFENPRKPQPTSSLTNVTTAAGPSEAPQAKNQRNFLSHPVTVQNHGVGNNLTSKQNTFGQFRVSAQTQTKEFECQPLRKEVESFPVTSRVNSSVSRETDNEQQNSLISGIDEQKGSQHQSNFVHQFGLSSCDESTIDKALIGMLPTTALTGLESFGLSTLAFSKLVSIITSSEFHHKIDEKTAETIIPFLSAYQLRGANNNVNQLISFFRSKFPLIGNDEPLDIKQTFINFPPHLQCNTTSNTFTKEIADVNLVALSSFSEEDGLISGSYNEEQEIDEQASPNELLKILCSDNAKNNTHNALLLQNYCLHRPDILDLNSNNFDEQVQILFSSKSEFSKELIVKIVNHSSALVIRKVIDKLLFKFDERFLPSSVINFVVTLCNSSPSLVKAKLDKLQCSFLTLYFVEALFQSPQEKDFTDELDKFVTIIQLLIQSSSVGMPKDKFSDISLHGFGSTLLAYLLRFFREQEAKYQNSQKRKQILQKLSERLFQKFPLIPRDISFLSISGDHHRQLSVLDIADADKILEQTISECFEMVKSTSSVTSTQTKDKNIVIDKLENLVKFTKTSPTLMIRQMPVIASKVQDLVENLSGREIRFSTAVPLLLYILDIIMIAMKRKIVLTFEKEGTQKDSYLLQIRSFLAVLKSIFQIFQNRKNRQIPFLTEKALQAIVLFIKENQNFSSDLLDDVPMLKEILDRQQHVLSQMDKEILKREISKITNVENL